MDKRIFAFLNCICWCNYAVVSGLPSTGSQQTITVKNCGRSILPPSSPDRIVGGNIAQHGQYPWMVSLQYYDKHVCGATVLNENWVITAAHCIRYVNEPRNYQLKVGLHKLSEFFWLEQRIRVHKILVHENYRGATIKGNDIALLRTSEPINIAGSRGFVNGICLPKDDKDPKGYAMAIGWGFTFQDGIKSDTLREVALPIVPRDICNESYDSNPHDEFDVIRSTMICAGAMTGKGLCQSDSGGPLFQTNSEGVSTLIGIVSFGNGCGRGFPDVFTKVSSFQSWIENAMA